MVYPHVDAKAVFEALRGLQRQLALVLNFPANIIGKPAVCIGDIAAALQHDDFRLLVQATDTRRRRRAARNAADNDNFLHKQTPF